jgi:hypothetical protein
MTSITVENLLAGRINRIRFSGVGSKQWPVQITIAVGCNQS